MPRRCCGRRVQLQKPHRPRQPSTLSTNSPRRRRIAWQPCNPAVGGPAKSQLVHEVDALGGEIGRMADRCYLQKRVLNATKVRLAGCAAACADDGHAHVVGADADGAAAAAVGGGGA
eukprot:scaffold929_cov387-Prasinococcus_capsulatus_cf.AAC.3